MNNLDFNQILGNLLQEESNFSLNIIQTVSINPSSTGVFTSGAAFQSLIQNAQFMSQIDQLVNELQQPFVGANLDIYMHQTLDEGDEEEIEEFQAFESEHSPYKYKTPTIALESPRECYICLVEKQEFNETCGDSGHLICMTCFDKLERFKGCPMCRKDLTGFVGREAMTTFFSTNTQIYQDLYDFYNSISNPEFKFKVTYNFGEFSDKPGFLLELKKRCLDLIEALCSSQNGINVINIALVRHIMETYKNTETPSTIHHKHALLNFSEIVMYEY